MNKIFCQNADCLLCMAVNYKSTAFLEELLQGPDGEKMLKDCKHMSFKQAFIDSIASDDRPFILLIPFMSLNWFSHSQMLMLIFTDEQLKKLERKRVEQFLNEALPKSSLKDFASEFVSNGYSTDYVSSFACMREYFSQKVDMDLLNHNLQHSETSLELPKMDSQDKKPFFNIEICQPVPQSSVAPALEKESKQIRIGTLSPTREELYWHNPPNWLKKEPVISGHVNPTRSPTITLLLPNNNVKVHDQYEMADFFGASELKTTQTSVVSSSSATQMSAKREHILEKMSDYLKAAALVPYAELYITIIRIHKILLLDNSLLTQAVLFAAEKILQQLDKGDTEAIAISDINFLSAIVISILQDEKCSK